MPHTMGATLTTSRKGFSFTAFLTSSRGRAKCIDSMDSEAKGGRLPYVQPSSRGRRGMMVQ